MCSKGTVVTLLSPIVFDLFGKENIPRNQAVSLLVDGCCLLIAVPLSGKRLFIK